MLNITYIITALNTGGAQVILYNLLSKLDRSKFSPSVICLMDRDTICDRIEALGITVYCLGMKRGIPSLATTSKLIKTVQRLKPDILQGWMYHGNIAAQLAGIFYFQKIPVLWCIHFSIASLKSEKTLTQAIVQLSAYLSKWVSKIIYVSQTSKKQHESLGYCRASSCIIPNGFDLSKFKPSQIHKLSVRSELGLLENTFLIGCMARYHPMKDHQNFLRAAALLLKTKPKANVHFILAGINVNTNNQELNQLVADLHLADRIHLLGERSDMPRLISALDIASLSSAYGEAFPMFIGEAMSCEVPCVATNVGDSAWMIENTGRIVPPRDSQALARVWQELIDLKEDERKSLGYKSRQRIIANFSLKLVVNQYEKLYTEISNNP